MAGGGGEATGRLRHAGVGRVRTRRRMERDRLLTPALRLDRSAQSALELAAALADPAPRSEELRRDVSLLGLAPIVYVHLRKAGRLHDLEPRHSAWLRSELERSAVRAVILRSAAVDISRRLREKDIPVLWLKGAWLASSVYELPGMRSMEDLDLLVPSSRLAQAERLLTEDGYDRDPLAFRLASSPHASRLRSRGHGSHLKVDLHHEVFPPAECGWATALAWEEAVPAVEDGVDVLHPGPEAGLLLIAMHLFKHHLDPKHRLRAVADVAALLRRHGDGLEWGRLRRSADEPFTAGILFTLLRVAAAAHLDPGAAELLRACESRLVEAGALRRAERIISIGTRMGRVRAHDACLVHYGRHSTITRTLPGLAERALSRDRATTLRLRRRLGGTTIETPGRVLREILPGANWRYTLTSYLVGRLDSFLGGGRGRHGMPPPRAADISR